LSDKKPGDFATVDAVADYVEKLVEGWASVIRCKAAEYGGAACNRIILIVFLDFYQPSPEDSYCVWDSTRRSAKTVRLNFSFLISLDKNDLRTTVVQTRLACDVACIDRSHCPIE
jgi:hypothetical protein